MELLLRNPADPGYPVEYLLSRIRGRRSKLVRDWKPLLYDAGLFDATPSSRSNGLLKAGSPEGVWRNLLQEYGWVYGQMNRELREVFGPFFLHSELRTIFICLRHLVEKKAGAVEELLNWSLLSGEMKDVLLSSADVPAAVKGVERLFRSLSSRFAGLSDVLETDGLRGAEQRLTETYLEVTVRTARHPIMKRFFSRVVDARNIMSLYKYLRLDLKTAPSFLPGGSIAEARMKDLVAKDDILAVIPLVRELTGMTIERPDPTAVELALYRGMTKWLKKEGREPFGAGPILDYLWRCSLEAMNLSVLHQARGVEREAVAAELVQ